MTLPSPDSLSAMRAADTAPRSEKWPAAVVALAERFHAPLEHIAALYQEKWRSLRDHATVTVYLPMLVEKHIKACLRAEAHQHEDALKPH
ncbi:DUF3562 domain-containing protein [Chitinimonas sp.]|uniref:DUF3562 domain-containing protein n=1 Tax=Chitinimonas sp. TaxID=1934313 RepID=UPI0035B3BC47